MIPIQTILTWFQTGKRPTQQQFADSWSSFWHKSESIPVANIDGITELFAPINNHFNDSNAHGNLIVKARVIPYGSFFICKPNPIVSDVLEVGNIGWGMLSDGVTFIPFGQYLGGDPQNVNNWNTSPMDFSPAEVIPLIAEPGPGSSTK
ncbi:hypothetical protein [Flavobacterium sp.]|uniref:hypothetical protein n=1 Tax=Flavobacterium sp. TaxID=239 RepID=UPI0037510565